MSLPFNVQERSVQGNRFHLNIMFKFATRIWIKRYDIIKTTVINSNLPAFLIMVKSLKSFMTFMIIMALYRRSVNGLDFILFVFVYFDLPWRHLLHASTDLQSQGSDLQLIVTLPGPCPTLQFLFQ